MGALGIIGILLILIGSYINNPLVLAAIIGALLIIARIMEVFDLFGTDNETQMGKNSLKNDLNKKFH
jgi:hypothetical protein